jgi:hypothetical protein
MKTCGQHADNGVAVTIKIKRLAENSWISAKSALPHGVTQNGYSRRSGFIFAGVKCATDYGLNSEH